MKSAQKAELDAARLSLSEAVKALGEALDAQASVPTIVELLDRTCFLREMVQDIEQRANGSNWH